MKKIPLSHTYFININGVAVMKEVLKIFSICASDKGSLDNRSAKAFNIPRLEKISRVEKKNISSYAYTHAHTQKKIITLPEIIHTNACIHTYIHTYIHACIHTYTHAVLFCLRTQNDQQYPYLVVNYICHRYVNHKRRMVRENIIPSHHPLLLRQNLRKSALQERPRKQLKNHGT